MTNIRNSRLGPVNMPTEPGGQEAVLRMPDRASPEKPDNLSRIQRLL